VAWASGDISTTGSMDGLGFVPRSASGVICEHVKPQLSSSMCNSFIGSYVHGFATPFKG
jgi:hypothetical protein